MMCISACLHGAAVEAERLAGACHLQLAGYGDYAAM